jgi:hypothetical protein
LPGQRSLRAEVGFARDGRRPVVLHGACLDRAVMGFR